MKFFKRKCMFCLGGKNLDRGLASSLL